MELVLGLGEVGRGDLERAGGKGANLGELVRAGLPVPPGFVVTTAAYDLFVARNDLAAAIAAALREESDGAAVRAAFEAGRIPAETERAVRQAYGRLGQVAVAVRSSATAEDLPDAAFAGQQDTYLNVVGADAVLDAVRRCWASLWTERAIAYRRRRGIDQAAAKLAVVVQRMVAAEWAGVLFTANPVTGAREVVVDASPGLGEAVVSGLVTPDHAVLRRRGPLGWRVAERRAGRREVVVRALAGGGTEHAAGAEAPPLPDGVLRELARLGAAAERHFGAPQDVEWAWDGGSLHVVQARPMTALPDAVTAPSRPVRMLASVVGEMLPARPYPLEATTWGIAVVLEAMVAPLFRLLGLAYSVEGMFVEEEGVVVRLSGRSPIRPTPRLLGGPARVLLLASRHDPAAWRRDALLAEALARARALDGQDPAALPWEGLLATARGALAVPFLLGRLRVRYLPRAAFAAARLRLLLALLGHGGRFGALVFSGVETKVLETNRALEALAARVRATPALAELFATRPAGELWAALGAEPAGQAFLGELGAFLDAYGHREAGGTLLLSQGTWRERPAVVLGILKGLAAAPPIPEGGPAAWETARDALLSHPLLRLARPRAAFLSLLAEARYVHQLREDTRFFAMLPLPALHGALLEMGRRLVGVGALGAAEEVFHLRFEELERLSWPPAEPRVGELRALVERRRAKRAALEGTPLVDPRLLGAGEGARAAGDALVRGVPGSPGVAEGPVRVIRDGAAFGALRPGEVLVAPYTNPAWTPLFQRAAAVVVDSGGAGSHAAIVAREYGIPAVMATGDGTARLADGQRVRVDGARGLVFGAAPGEGGASPPG